MGIIRGKREELLLAIYAAMLERLGTSGWWPASSAFEVMAGAVLVQNTAWENAKKAIESLKSAHLMEPADILQTDETILARHIRSSGFYRQKARRLKTLCRWLMEECGGNFDLLKTKDLPILRQNLLNVPGIGPETADSILLYALEKPSFVVDAYTRRIFSRHGLVAEDTTYEELRDFFQDVLVPDTELFNEFHALLVRAGKEWCRKRNPRCQECPLFFLESGC